MSAEASTERYRQHFDDMYSWSEGLCHDRGATRPEEVARFWTDDARMITNGAIEAAGLASLQEHFDRVSDKYERITVGRPYHVYFEDGDSVVIEYEIVGDVKPGKTAIATGDHARQHVRVIAIFTMRDGRIAEMREVAGPNHGGA